MVPNIELNEDEPFEIAFPNGQTVIFTPDGRIEGAEVPSSNTADTEGTYPATTDDPRASSAYGEMSWAEHRASPIVTPGGTGAWNEKRADVGGDLTRWADEWYYYGTGMDANDVRTIGLYKGDSLGSLASVSENPLVSGGGSGAWDNGDVGSASIIDVANERWLYYQSNGKLGLAKSAGGVSFTKYSGNPLFDPGGSGTWDEDFHHLDVVYDGNKFVMAFAASSGSEATTRSQIGVATSDDGYAWSKVQSSPVIPYGPTGSYKEHGVLAPRLWVDDGTYYMNFASKPEQSGTNYSDISHAWATDLTDWSLSSNNPVLDSANTSWTELEWGYTVRVGRQWILVCPAWFDSGKGAVFVAM